MFFTQHSTLLDAARAAYRERSAWTGFAPITPPSVDHALEVLRGYGGRTLRTSDAASGTLTGAESSPFTGTDLNVSYSAPTVEEAIAGAESARGPLAAAGVQTRVGVCMEALTRIADRGAEFAAVSSHTTGQSLAMACSGSGTNALDRGLEAVVAAFEAQTAFPSTVRWQSRFGKTEVTLDKRFQPRPLGTALVIACASFPAWNAYPAILANLAVGDPVLVKPHPTSILGTALAVEVIRGVLTEAGLPADAVQLVVDLPGSPIADVLARRDEVRIVDFTGSPAFGDHLEQTLPRSLVFTETAGVNTVIIDSVDDLSAFLRTLATALSLFSGQMCTTPQNLYVADTGIRTPDGVVSRDEFTRLLVAELDALTGDVRRVSSVAGALQSGATRQSLDEFTATAAADGTLLRKPEPYEHPDYPAARTATPLVISADPRIAPVREGELFGPIVQVIGCADRNAAVAHATESVSRNGAISSYLYCTESDEVIDSIADAYAAVGASLSCNLVSSMPMQYAAAYSDLHVTGLNPAGNATLTEPSFITGRFRWVQDRRQVMA